MKNRSAIFIAASVLLMGLGLKAEEYDLIAHASGAQWSNSDKVSIRFGAEGRNKGTAKYVTEAKMEDNRIYRRVLFTHPRWGKDGAVKGEFRGLTLPRTRIRLVIAGGLLSGAGRSDGVRFSAQFLPHNFVSVDPRAISSSRCSFRSRYDGRIDRMECDLTPFAGQTGTLVLTVSAENNADFDWAAWTEARLVTGTGRSQADTASIRDSWAKLVTKLRIIREDVDSLRGRIIHLNNLIAEGGSFSGIDRAKAARQQKEEAFDALRQDYPRDTNAARQLMNGIAARNLENIEKACSISDLEKVVTLMRETHNSVREFNDLVYRELRDSSLRSQINAFLETLSRLYAPRAEYLQRNR